MFVEVNSENNTLNIKQEITFKNESDDYLSEIVLNDWNNAYSDVDTPLARRFSDEFYRGFHLAKEEERGSTNNINILDDDSLFLSWERTEENPDIVIVKLRQKLAPHKKTTLHLTYNVKIPSDKFTKYGYNDKGVLNLKSWFLTPARYENHAFTKYSNQNLDDIANASSDFDIEIKVNDGFEITTDLNTIEHTKNTDFSTYKLSGKNRVDFGLFIEPKCSFNSFKCDDLEVVTNLDEQKLTIAQQAKVIESVVGFVDTLIGKYPFEKILISQTNYDRNPFYGLYQLPSFISPFTDEFSYEIKFLKTYLNAYLDNSLLLDNRKNSWIHDGIQIYTMMKYIEEKHPNSKMLGNASSFILLKGFSLTNVEFNEQYSYFYMLMARKNLDQPLGESKDSLVKFNAQIASKYRAGLSLRYLDNYLENDILTSSIHQFYSENINRPVANTDFEAILKANTNKDINWFFDIIINSRKIIDYKFSYVKKTKNSVFFSIKNKTGVIVPIPVYGIKKREVVFKNWIIPNEPDSIYQVERKDADKIVLNYKNEVPEYNLRNNWKTLKNFFPNNRPVKFAFMKDLEDPYYNQILYVPTLNYNYYDGLIPGLRLHNRTILPKPFVFDINPAYSTKTRSLSGAGHILLNQNFRESRLYNINYLFSGAFFHYAPDATYTKINPAIQLNIREKDFRDNRKQTVLLRQVVVKREKSSIIIDNSTENYSVFNAKYFNTKTEVTNHFGLITDAQLAGKFGKLSAEIEYRELFKDNHRINLRCFAGAFLYNNSNSDYFSFALDRPTDYLFDYNFYGRSESTGFFSQQFIMAEGGFKSKLDTPYANRWIGTINGSYNIWNWIEVYGDVGLVKNKLQSAQFVYDSGIRFNFLTDYFEVFFPVYSSNGWEIGQDKYNEKIRFVITLKPRILANLFKRKWF